MTSVMSNGRRRWAIMVAVPVSVLILVGTPVVMVVQQASQNDKLAAQQETQDEVIDSLREVFAQLAERRAEDDAIRRAATRLTCQKTNYALRANREAIAAAEQALIDVLRMSPHSAAVADEVAASLPPLPTAEQSESDCAPPTGLGPEDYSTP